ncbi:MAG: UvrD-helicase domain-containing protein, partial [Spirochaetota bacterium]
EILALTFTRKAAAEMYERIYRALLEQTDDAFVREQLADFDSAVISTLDSFCSGIARNGCARFGVPATFTIDERSLEAMAGQLALAFLTEHAAHPVVADLIRLNSFGSLWKDGLARLAVDHFSVADDRDLSSYLPAQRRFLVDEHARLAVSLRSALEAIAALDPEGPKCVRDAQTIVDALDLDRVLPEPNDVEGAPEAADRIAAELAAIDRMHKRCGTSKHPDVPLYKEYLDEAQELAARFVIATYTLARWDDAERPTELLERFRERVVSEKRRLALLSYHDVTRLAIRTLTEDTALRSFYKERFGAVMIDEFQDNNDEQKELLYLVAERADVTTSGVPPASALDPGKLFFVGDEKQSIYRFRGADVSVFRTLASELASELAPTDLRLGANYRSEPGLIRFFNELFPLVFADPQHDYEARFEPLRSREPTPGVTPRVELWRLEQRESPDTLFLDDTDAEAYHIASWIRSAVDERALPVRAEDGGVRPAGYADVAILMRSSSNQIRLERMLRLFGIPYVSQAARSLFLEAPVNDIYQALQLVLYPDDRVAFAGYLRSPLVGLSDEGIVRQLLFEEELLGEVAGHSVDDEARIALARERYEELCALADSRPITELLHTIWYDWGYRYHLLRREQYVPYLEYYDLFWELAHSFEADGLAAFVDEVRRHMGQNEKLDELEIIRGEADGVQIMTIHKSKGLEFPVVVVANAGNRGRNDSVSAEPFYWSSTLGLAFNTGVLPPGAVREKASNYLYTHELDERTAQERAELKRLLYVAATRAESHLVFSGIPRDDARSLMGILAPAFDTAREALEGADDVVVSARDLEPVPAEEERQARRSEARRDIGTL